MSDRNYYAKPFARIHTPSLLTMRRMCIDHMASAGEDRMTVYAAYSCKRVEGYVVFNGNRYLWETTTGRRHMILSDGSISRKTV